MGLCPSQRLGCNALQLACAGRCLLACVEQQLLLALPCRTGDLATAGANGYIQVCTTASLC